MIGFSPSLESVADVRRLFATEPVHEAFDGFARVCFTSIMAENLARGQFRLHKGISDGTLLPLGVGRQVYETLTAASFFALDKQDSQATTLRRVVSDQQGVLTSRVATELFGDLDPSLAKGPRFYQRHLQRLALVSAVERATTLPDDEDSHIHAVEDVKRKVVDQAGLALSGLRLLDHSLRKQDGPILIAHFHDRSTVEAITGYAGGRGLRGRHAFSDSVDIPLHPNARRITATYDELGGFGKIKSVRVGGSLGVPIGCLAPVVQVSADELGQGMPWSMGELEGMNYWPRPHTVVVTEIGDARLDTSPTNFPRKEALNHLVSRAQEELHLVA